MWWERSKITWCRAPLPEGIKNLECLALENHYPCLTPVPDVEEALTGIRGEGRAGGGRPVPARRGQAPAADEHLIKVFASRREYLHALAPPI